MQSKTVLACMGTTVRVEKLGGYVRVQICHDDGTYLLAWMSPIKARRVAEACLKMARELEIDDSGK